MWKIESLVSEQDIDYEHALARNPGDPQTWKLYLEANSSQLPAKQIFVVERAVSAIPKYEPLWLAYIDILVPLVQGASYYHHKNAFLAVNQVFERALHFCSSSSEIWSRYLQFLVTKQRCEVTTIRRQFNRALKNLKDQASIWPSYLEYAQMVGGETEITVLSRYLEYADQSPELETLQEHLMTLIESTSDDSRIAEVIYRAIEKQPTYSLTTSYLTVLENLSETNPSQELDQRYFQTVKGAISRYTDQLGSLYARLGQFYAQRAQTQKARHTFNKGLQNCKSVADFITIFDSWTQFEEQVVTELSEQMQDHDNEENNEESIRLDLHMDFLDNLLHNRSLLLSDMQLRQDPNNLDHWFSRLELFDPASPEGLNKILRCYAQALSSINPLKAHSISSHSLAQLWTQYAKVYADKGDWKTTYVVFSRSVTSQFSSVDELIDLYTNWCETVLGSTMSDADTKAQEIVENALKPVKASSDIRSQLHKSPRLWLYYIDLLESCLDEHPDPPSLVEKICRAYDEMISLKIASPSTIIANAAFLEQREYYERSFTIFERGLKLFHDSDIRFELWNVYLPKLIAHKVDSERIRELFDRCVSECPAHLARPFIILYFQYESDHGGVLKSLKILQNGIEHLGSELAHASTHASAILADKYQLYLVLLSKLVASNDVGASRKSYETALADDQLTLKQLKSLTQDFIAFESKQRDVTRVRALYKYICGLCDIENHKDIWSQWESFELESGSEITFKEMLRFKREVVAKFAAVAHAKSSLNPMGFVKSNSQAPQSNPDQIDLDM